MHPSFDDAALRCEGTSIRLLASQCSRCENISFPCRERCAKCYAPRPRSNWPSPVPSYRIALQHFRLPERNLP